MEVSAKNNMIRIAARKVRLVADLIRNKKITNAIAILKNTNKRSSKILLKLLNSALANAVENNGLEADSLFISKILVNEGKTLKRMHPRAHGRAYSILKRSSKVEITLSDNKAIEKRS